MYSAWLVVEVGVEKRERWIWGGRSNFSAVVTVSNNAIYPNLDSNLGRLFPAQFPLNFLWEALWKVGEMERLPERLMTPARLTFQTTLRAKVPAMLVGLAQTFEALCKGFGCRRPVFPFPHPKIIALLTSCLA